MQTEKYCIFDLEIVKAIPPRDEADRIPGIEYCSGWKDFRNMGISCISFCVMVLQGDRVLETENFCYEWDTEIALNHITFMREDDFLVGGFNSRKFDDQLLTANGIEFTSDFDILEWTIAAANLEGVKYWEMEPKRSYSLDAITKANGAVKTGKGDLAPIWWQQGEKQRVIDYCRNDSQIEAEMLRLLMAGKLIDPNTGEMLRYPSIESLIV
jgi:hypothetical protein